MYNAPLTGELKLIVNQNFKKIIDDHSRVLKILLHVGWKHWSFNYFVILPYMRVLFVGKQFASAVCISY